MISGPRAGQPGWLTRLLSRAVSRQLTVFVVPGLEVVRAQGLDVDSAGLEVVTTPRHASVLLILGDLPDGLRKAAAVAYAQMPRPRAIYAVGTHDVSPLPTPDITVPLGQAELIEGIERLRELFASGAWGVDVRPFETDELMPKRGRAKSRPKPEQMSADQERRAAEGTSGSDMQRMDHGAMSRQVDSGANHGPVHRGDGSTQRESASSPDAGAPQHKDSPPQEGMQQGKMSRQKEGSLKSDSSMQQGKMDKSQAGMRHAGMRGMGFMSMVRLTRSLPRSEDGLPMERVPTPFGPVFPGLPAGLSVTFHLDGDSVARTEVSQGAVSRELEATWPGDTKGFAERLSRLDPLAPASYRILAERALNAAGGERGHVVGVHELIALERERVASHLNWLASFAYLLGNVWLTNEAVRLHRSWLASGESSEARQLQPRVLGFLGKVRRTPLLRTRLEGIGVINDPGIELSGPVARAAGRSTDARTLDPLYRSLGFQPITREEGDAMARLEVRLDEIAQSLELLSRASDIAAEALVYDDTVRDEAVVETPRGTARLRVRLDGDSVREIELTTPSTPSYELVERVATGFELADALVGVASLDISPWEVDR